MRGQLFSTDFLASILVMTVMLGLFLHALELPAAMHPGAPRQAALLSQAALSGFQQMRLNVSLATQAGSLCPPGSLAHCLDLSGVPVARPDGNASMTLLTEAGVPLGPAHSVPSDVGQSGGGRYADVPAPEGPTLVFSSSDGSDPRTNGRPYELGFVSTDGVFERACLVLSAVDGFVLNAVCPADCRAVDAVDRYVDCGSRRCILSVRSCA